MWEELFLQPGFAQEHHLVVEVGPCVLPCTTIFPFFCNRAALDRVFGAYSFKKYKLRKKTQSPGVS